MKISNNSNFRSSVSWNDSRTGLKGAMELMKGQQGDLIRSSQCPERDYIHGIERDKLSNTLYNEWSMFTARR